MINSLEPSELATQLTMGSLELNDLDVVIFFERMARAATFHLCSNMHVSEAYNFNGPVIATDLKTAYKLIQFPTPKPKFFFLNDLEWVHFPQKNYDTLEAIYRNKELTLLARHEEHAKLIEKCWNVHVDSVVPNYEFFGSSFLEYLKGKINRVEKYVNPPVIYKPILNYI